MVHQQPISVSILLDALECKRSQKITLEADIEELERAIRQLQGPGSEIENVRQEPRQPPAPTMIDGETATHIVSFQERAVEDDEAYPPAKFKGMSRIEIAVTLAQDFDGYLATSAYRKVLSKPDVLRSTKQVGSVASRVLAHSQRFHRCWEGLYQLKESYRLNGKVPVQEARITQ